MRKKIDLDGSHIITSAEKVSKLCKPLEDLFGGIFSRYGKVFNDGSRIILSNNIDLFRWTYEENNYHLTWRDHDLPISQFQSTTWAVQRLSDTEEQRAFRKEMLSQFGVSEGMHIVKRSVDFIEILSFGSDNFFIYDLKKSHVNRFIYYFKEQAKDLIEAAERERIRVPLYAPSKSINLPKTSEDRFLTTTQVNRYYLSGQYQGPYLTSREVECLNWSVMGKTMEEVDRILHISKKTVERHIDNIKRKLHLEKQSQLISFYILCDR